MQTLLGIDLGTSGVKAALFAAEDGAVLTDAFVDYPLYHPHPGWAEQNPADWWQATLTAVRTCLVQGATQGAQASDVRGVGLSGQMHGVVLLDAEQRVLRPCIIWADQRSDPQCRWITEKVAELSGLRAGTPVAGGGAENACGAVGNGVVVPGLGLVSIGTSGVVLAYADTPQVDTSGPVPRVHTFNHAVPHAWYLMGVTQGAGLSLRWVRDNIGLPEQALERWTGMDAYEFLAKEAESVAPGSDGLIFLPYLQGERTPHLDAYARGGWIGLTASHDRRHLVRAVLEGVAFSLKDCFAIIRQQGLELEQLRATGGGAKSA